MRNRWFHIPLLHIGGQGHHKRVGWLELFYDLIFVAAFIQLGNGLSEHVTLGGCFGFAAIFTPLWFVWTGYTYYVNRFTVDDFVHRMIVFAQMFAVGAMAISAPNVFNGHPKFFAVACGTAQAIVLLLYARTWPRVPAARPYSIYWGSAFGISAALWLISAFLSQPWCYVLWAIGIGLILVAPFSRYSRMLTELYPTDQEHLSERYGLLTIIVLGESFVKVLSSLTTHTNNLYLLMQAGFILLITCCLWWIYFDDIAGSEVKKQRLSPVIWLFSHLPLHIAITATGVAVKKAVFFDLTIPAPLGYRWFLSGALGLAFISTGMIDSVTGRANAELSDKHRINARLASAIFILLLAPVGDSMSAALYVALIAGICAAQVIFDMMLAPYDSVDHPSHAPVTTAELALRRASGDMTVAAPAKLRSLNQIIRKGTPSELRRDIYFYFMEGSWTRFIAALGVVYLLTNAFFGALYLLEPDSIVNARPKNFSDAFFFSVQTLGTIGYGVLSPKSAYANAIVTVEAAAGLLGIALVTGLAVSKAARAKASALFSRSMVLSTMHGKPTLVFRVGNARGNEVVDANMTVTALTEELSPEGHHLRRMHDIKLVRSRSPLFVLSWVVMHEVDESSPLYGVDFSTPDHPILSFIVTLTGHDGTYGQTIYARYTYYPADIRLNHRFVDVISQLPDGRMMVDYAKFHDTAPVL